MVCFALEEASKFRGNLLQGYLVSSKASKLCCWRQNVAFVLFVSRKQICSLLVCLMTTSNVQLLYFYKQRDRNAQFKLIVISLFACLNHHHRHQCTFKTKNRVIIEKERVKHIKLHIKFVFFPLKLIYLLLLSSSGRCRREMSRHNSQISTRKSQLSVN